MLKIGVIGTGSMGKNHARVCSELKNIELLGIVDNDRSTAQTVAQRVGVEAFIDYKDLLPKVDAAIIATPTLTHYKIAMDFLNNGKHVLVEKPLCDSVDKGKELAKKADKEGLVLAVGHIERHNPAVKFVKEAISDKSFGELITLSSKRVSNFPGRIRDVGVIFDFGVHDIDVMRYLVGEIKSVYAKAGKVTGSIDYEDHATILLNFETGICGVVEVNWLTPLKIRKLFLTCSKNYVEADYIDQSVTISSSSFKDINEMNLYRVPIQYNVNTVALEKKEPLKNEIQDFVESVKQSKKPLASGDDGYIVLEIAEAVISSYKNGEEVAV